MSGRDRHAGGLRIALSLWVMGLALGACAPLRTETPQTLPGRSVEAAVPPAVPAVPDHAAVSADASAPAAAPITASEPAPASQPAAALEPAPASEPPSARSARRPAAPSNANGGRSAGSGQGKPPASSTERPAAAAKPPGVPPALQKPPAPPALDLTALVQRLRETRAIGVFTKLSLKNQVDDLLDEFRAYHKGQAKIALAQLRQRYDLILIKVLSLLQDSDAGLAAAIVSSRESIWGVLTDPEKFAKI